MGIKEYGQAASEVELQDNPGPIKNQDGESVIEVTNDGGFRILNESDTTKYVESAVLSNGQVTTELVGAASAGITFVRSGGIYSMTHYQATGDKSGGVYPDSVSGNGFSVGISQNNGFIEMRKAGSTLSIGVADQDAITIDSSKNATFVANLSTNGNATLGDAAADNHVVNGTLRLASEHSTGPSAPADGDGGILYCKDDGKLYFVSEDVTETDLTAGGGGGYTLETKTASFTAALEFIYVITGAAAVTVTLPDAGAADSAGKSIKFKCTNAATNAVTFARNSGDSIDGVAVDLVVTTNNYAFELVSDGSNWQIF